MELQLRASLWKHLHLHLECVATDMMENSLQRFVNRNGGLAEALAASLATLHQIVWEGVWLAPRCWNWNNVLLTWPAGGV